MRIPFSLAVLVSSAAAAAIDPRSYSTCTKPTVRKEWRDLSKEEKKSFIDSIKCLDKLPGSDDFVVYGWNAAKIVPPVQKRSLFDDFVYSHMDTNPHTHFVGQDLWWHRMYLIALENALHEKCGYEGGIPYWDWSLDVHDMEHSPVFDPDPVYGLGTWGTAESNWTVTDGAFADTIRTYPEPHVFKRKYVPKPFVDKVFPFDFDQPDLRVNDTVAPEKIQFMIENYKGDAIGFQTAFEGHRCQGPHNSIHLLFGWLVGGDMSNAFHPGNDMIFWMHHSNVDRIWQKWKDYDEANKFAIGGGTVQALELFLTMPQGLDPPVAVTDDLATSGLAPPVTIADIMTTTQGYSCYKYQDPKGGYSYW